MIERAFDLLPDRPFFRTLAFAVIAVAAPLALSPDSEIEKSQGDRSKRGIRPNLQNAAIYFEPNTGQNEEEVKYLARGRGFNLFLTPTKAVYVLKSGKENSPEQGIPDQPLKKTRKAAIFMELMGADEHAAPEGAEELPGKVNYISGSDPDKWKTGVATYASVLTEDVYPGIDLIWRGKEGGAIRYDFVVNPGGSPDSIEWEISGANSASINPEGDLVLVTDAGNLVHRKPITYQDSQGQRTNVESEFALVVDDLPDPSVTKVRFSVGEYDRSKALVIDPTVLGSNLAFSTFLGGDNFDNGTAIAADSNGNVYVTGVTGSVLNSAEFPTTAGAFDTTFNGGSLGDAFVSKFSADGSTLLYSTYLGGSNDDNGRGIAVDSLGRAYVTGVTASVDFPVTAGAYDETLGSLDAYVVRLSADGSALEYGTFLGGIGIDEGRAIAVDSNFSAYVTGKSRSNDFPVTTGVVQGSRAGGDDAYVTKFNADGTGLVYSTFLGGDQDDIGKGIAVNSAGEAFVTGETKAGTPDFPVTSGAFDETHNGGIDAFVSRLNSGATALTYSTFLGGTLTDRGNGIVVDNTGNAYVTGTTGSSDYPTTAGAYDETANGLDDIFVTKLNSSGSALTFSTYIGGSSLDSGNGIGIDSSLYVSVTGSAFDGVPGFPTTPDAFDGTHNGSTDVVLARLDPTGSILSYSTFIGGSLGETGFGIATLPTGDSHIVGTAGSFNFPTTAGSFDPTHNFGDSDVFVSRFSFQSSPFAPYDFDGDGKTDVSIFRPGLGQWWIYYSSTQTSLGVSFGVNTDIPVPNDFTGDGKDDVAFFRPSTNEWFVIRSEDMTFFAFPFGAAGDIPAPGDFDGDGKTDAAVYRPTSGTWFALRSSDSQVLAVPFGIMEDVPTVADFDGDGMDDIAQYRPSVNQWWQFRSSAGIIGYQFGSPGDRTAVGDYTGDGKADVAFFRDSTSEWFVIRSEDSTFFAFPWGASGDIPAPGDFDGDSVADAAVYRPSIGTWFINGSTSGFQAIQFGLSNDVPLPNSRSAP